MDLAETRLEKAITKLVSEYEQTPENHARKHVLKYIIGRLKSGETKPDDEWKICKELGITI